MAAGLYHKRLQRARILDDLEDFNTRQTLRIQSALRDGIENKDGTVVLRSNAQVAKDNQVLTIRHDGWDGVEIRTSTETKVLDNGPLPFSVVKDEEEITISTGPTSGLPAVAVGDPILQPV